MVRVPCTTESMPLNTRIFASVQLASREALTLLWLGAAIEEFLPAVVWDRS